MGWVGELQVKLLGGTLNECTQPLLEGPLV